MARWSWSLAALLALGGLAQRQEEPKAEDKASLQDFVAFEQWLQSYRDGACRLLKDSVENPQAVAQVDLICGALARWNNVAAAKKLLEAASVEPRPQAGASNEAIVDFQRETMPWRVQQIARAHLKLMTGPGVEQFLINECRFQPNSATDRVAAARRNAAMRVLAAKDSIAGQLALLEATGSWPPEERVRAVVALGESPALETIPHLLLLCGSSEPNARIAALGALGKALGPHTDETGQTEISLDVQKLRDQTVAKLTGVLVRDPVWQARAAAAESLALLRCKAAIPALIEGLEAEAQKKKDPWAMDLRLHRLLEGLTGQDVARGDPRVWRDFWQKAGPGFRFTADQALAQKSQQRPHPRYAKFFTIDLESDRVLFVVDFSGSMAETVKLKAKPGGTAAAPQAGGSETTKSKLIVAELKKLITALPDGTLFNLLLFSDEVRAWREGEGGRPALVRIDDGSRDELLGSFLDSLHPQGKTNLHGALDRALEFAGRGLYDKWYGAAFDTLYVISDGAPSCGQVIDRDEILRLVRESNRLKKLTIHTVTFGDLNETRFLKTLAEENGGRHIHIE
jgi:hypothetical protein